jgi:transposase
MREKLYVVSLSEEERLSLEAALAQGRLTPRQSQRARALLLSEQGFTDADIAAELGLASRTVERIRENFSRFGLGALSDRPRKGRPAKFDGKVEALIVSLACTPSPQGQARWTLKQLGKRLLALEVVESISDSTICRVLKKTTSSPGRDAPGACRR